ncbi:MAG TPA: hypothetical protein PL040_07490, partial [Bacteroidales bacterium]|nr:hypothetical protein [Bacteroidales bacterium]
NRDHFLHLVQVAKTDGQIQKEEHEMLHRQGKKFGLTDPEIDDMIKSESPENYHPPYSLEDKFYELYNITELILSDEKVSEREKKMIKRYAIAAGLPDDLTESLCRILIEGVQNETDEETLLKEFRKIVRNKYRN